jgi:hypothetical protein
VARHETQIPGNDMSENVSRRKALSVLGAASVLALALTRDKGEAATDGRRQHGKRRVGQLATAPAAASASAGPTYHEVPNGLSGSEHMMQMQYRFH